MDRKEFLKGCASGLCACAAAFCVPAAAAESKPDDGRLAFVKQRYAKLLQTLSQKMSPEEVSATLQELGKFCASQNDGQTAKFRGNVDGYRKLLAEHGSSVSYDAERKVYTLIYSPGSDCPCPFANGVGKTPEVMCECSRGWTAHAWGVVLERETKVALKESFLRGGKVCKFEII
jgi:hypothetical protein